MVKIEVTPEAVKRANTRIVSGESSQPRRKARSSVKMPEFIYDKEKVRAAFEKVLTIR
ncbi:hypothetical protein PSDVSF_32240 [Pseudodesulfovibrio sediminis]|uniref:Uncharacterized protein n=1 Tax=Pseudodesulfovibrio sediminis TaxID=2810563 RepID=A0ABN6EUI1_9BACT|nr:hypothetical protein PSDVSF_32240 [Pseudodesulfovibrio sediminis]